MWEGGQKRKEKNQIKRSFKGKQKDFTFKEMSKRMGSRELLKRTSQ